MLPWEPTTFIFRGYNPYIGGLKPSFFMVLGSKGIWDSKSRIFFPKKSEYLKDGTIFWAMAKGAKAVV